LEFKAGFEQLTLIAASVLATNSGIASMIRLTLNAETYWTINTPTRKASISRSTFEFATSAEGKTKNDYCDQLNSQY
jgi:hypothetical protein